MNKRERYERDERLGVLHNFLYGFGGTFLVIFFNSYILIFLYNRLIEEEITIGYVALFMLLQLVLSSIISSIIVYFTRMRVYSRNIQRICKAVQKVAQGDFSVRLNVFEDKVNKTEMDLLKEDFNTMVTELASIDGLRDSFIADVSHEIKTPLSVIQGYVELLQVPDISREQQQEYIKNISFAVNNLKILTSNILRLNKLENQAIIQSEVFSVDEQVRCCVLSYEESIDEKNIELDIELAEVNIKTDKGLLEIVWNNLISNAIKFNKPGGVISIRMAELNGGLLFIISDTGCGMEPSVQEHIFDKFYQGDDSRSQLGNGLGLALVRKVVDLLGGNIEVDSDLGDGSEFMIYIPGIVV